MKLLYQNGVILDATELACAPSYTGTSVLESELDAGHRSREARLFDSLENALHDVVSPLSAAEIVSMDEQQILVRGYELSANADAERRYLQCWLLRLLGDEQQRERGSICQRQLRSESVGADGGTREIRIIAATWSVVVQS